MRNNPRYAAKMRYPAFLHASTPPTLPKNQKTEDLRPEICDLWPIFQLFRLTALKNSYL